jgi:hypothetical protein
MRRHGGLRSWLGALRSVADFLDILVSISPNDEELFDP